jgi:phosphatidylserine/phosphatidylglycerophosphate/cardiolipin synthase-like enzyme
MPLCVKESGMESVGLVSGRFFLDALGRARSVELTSSFLPQGKAGVMAALERAAERGADVRVHLEPEPYDSGGAGRAAANEAMVAELRAHGVDAGLAVEMPNAPLHLKAAVVDGRAFLDDRNWLADGRDTIVFVRGAHETAAVCAAMCGGYIADDHVAVRKREALALEADMIDRATHGVVVESESFGSGVIARALLACARAGESVRLLVSVRDVRSAREVAVLSRLEAEGVRVRVEGAGDNEKFCISGDRVWVGSANATGGFPDTVDWGVRTRARGLVHALRVVFERNWSHAKAFVAHCKPS